LLDREKSKDDLRLFYEEKIAINIEHYEEKVSLLHRQLVESVIEDNIRNLLHQEILNRNDSILNERDEKYPPCYLNYLVIT